MNGHMVFGASWVAVATLYFQVAANFDQIAYRNAWLMVSINHVLKRQETPLAVQLGFGEWHRVDAAALVEYFNRVPGWSSQFDLLILGSLVSGVLVSCTVCAAAPQLFSFRRERDSHRRGARLLQMQVPRLFRGKLRRAWINGGALSVVTWTVQRLFGEAQAADFAHAAVAGVQFELLRALGVGYGLSFSLALLGSKENKAVRGALKLGHVAVPRAAELYHFLVAGRTGAGKTQAIQQLLRPVNARGDRGLVADPDGGYLSRFGSSSDLILNPFDRRGLRWSPFAEIRAPFDYDVLANAVVPQGNTANEEEWRRFGRVLLAATLKKLHEEGRASAREVLHMINAASDEELQTMLAGTNAAGLRRHDAMFHSILGVVTPHIQSWEYLVEPDAAHPPFSIRDWVRNDGSNWLFLPYRDDQLDALKYLIATWVGLAVVEGLSLPENLDRRFWYVIDELDSLGKVSSLRLAATKLRKHGGVLVAGLQTVAQLRATYGHDEAQVLLSSLANKLILALGDHETARYFQDELGQREIERRRITTQSGRAGDRSTGSASQSTEVALEHLVLASELQGLPERRGYLRRAGDPLIHPVRIPLVPMPARIAPFLQGG